MEEQNNNQPRIIGYDPYTGEPRYAQPESAQPAAAPEPPAATALPATPSHGPHAAYGTHTAASIEHAKPAKAKAAGGSKNFLVSFVGAALACLLVCTGYHFLFGSSKAATVSLGAGSSESIAVKGEDTTLAEAVAAKCTPSVGCIYVYAQQSANSYLGLGMNNNSGSQTLTQSSLGSGVVLNNDGYMVTNYHVVEGAAALKVSLGGEEYDAELVGSDESSDLAVIKLKDAKNLTPIALGDSDALTIGDWVMTIGSPFGLEQSVATGIVSATSRSQIMNNSSSSYYGSGETTVYVNLIQTDAAINPGNSGGALVNANGELIGINTLITSYSGNYSGVGFAIPVNYAVSVAKQIIAGETPSHAQLGVSLVSVTDSIAKRYNLPVKSGAYISSVSTGGAADKAGLKVGDIVVKFDSKNITSSSELMIAVREKNPGDTATVTVNRDGKEESVQVTLGSDADKSNISGNLLQQNNSL